MTENKTGTAYTMGRSAAETERLIEQSHLYERVTLRMLRNAGVDTGMKVLDIGSGAGDVAMAAAQLVGPQGSVVGVDMNAAILETARARVRQAGHHNITFIAGDAREVELANDFDALVGRLVLMYLPDPGTALRQLVTHLRPRGIVAFQEAELVLYQSVRTPETPFVNQLVEWGLEVFRRSGANVGMGLELYHAFVEAGLPAPVSHLEAPAGGGPDWVGYEFLKQGFASLLPLMEAYGIATAEQLGIDTFAERLQQEADAAGRLIVLPPHVTAYTRLPA